MSVNSNASSKKSLMSLASDVLAAVKYKQATTNIRTDGAARIVLYRMLISQIRRNINPRTACFRLYNEIILERPNDRLAMAYGSWYKKMDSQGVMLCDAVVGWIPNQEIMLIRSGESAGMLLEGLESALASAVTNSHLSSLIMKAAVMPLVLLCMSYGSILMMATIILPNIADLIPENEWPEMSLPYKYFAEFVAEHVTETTFGLVFVIGLIMGTLSKFVGPMRAKLDSLPPWSLHRRLTSAGFLDSFAGLLSRGNAPFDSLVQMRETVSPYMGWHIDRMLRSLTQNGDVSAALIGTGLFDLNSRLVIKTTSEDGGFSENIKLLAVETVDSVTSFVTVFSSAAQFAFLALVGVSIMWGMGSMGLVILEFYQKSMSF